MLVIDGKVELTSDGSVVDIVRPGDFFGERALLGAAKRGMGAEAAEPTTVAVLSRSSFEAILADSEELAAKVSWNFLIRMMGKLRHMDEVQFRNPQLASIAQSSGGGDLDDTSDLSKDANSTQQSTERRSSQSDSIEQTSDLSEEARKAQAAQSSGGASDEEERSDNGEATDSTERRTSSSGKPADVSDASETSTRVTNATKPTERRSGSVGTSEAETSGSRAGVGPPSWDPNDDTLVPSDRDPNDDTLVPGKKMGGGDSDADDSDGEDSNGDGASADGSDASIGASSSGAKVLKKGNASTDEVDSSTSGNADSDAGTAEEEEAMRETIQFEEIDPESINRD